ncbi:centromere protein V isoform X2 [Corythoichthys intestinalis]|uniref:centromere protein V isoform X2 n=1 Tax=Corythoichthys intestinalis TaxID=161448 RepID=UPI0025A5ECD9|nr:centromere protein V isoform X2 [Corythoichthys intestinalis]
MTPNGLLTLQLGGAFVSITGFARNKMDLVKHTGGCHCGAVRFEVWNSPNLHVFDCNCSVCTKKQNQHFIVPKSNFTLVQGEDHLTTYTFNTHVAKHTFCKKCGVQSFYTPRSNPDGYGMRKNCLHTQFSKHFRVMCCTTLFGSRHSPKYHSRKILGRQMGRKHAGT